MATVELLPKEEICFVKKINLENNYFSGVVCYTRKFSENYKMQPYTDGKDTLLYHYQEDEYPSDLLDEVILQAIQQQYPKATCHTSIQMFNVDSEQNKHWKDQHHRSVVTLRIFEDAAVSLPNYTEPFMCPYQCFELEIYKFDVDPNAQSNDDLFLYHVNNTDYKEIKRLLSSFGQL